MRRGRTGAPDRAATGVRKRWVAGLVGTLLAVAAAGPAQAADDEEPLAAQQLAAQTYPGVQLVQVDFTATLTVPDSVTDATALEVLFERLAVQAANGTIGTSDEEVLEAVVDAVAADPFRYLKPVNTSRSIEASLTGFGTGFVVSPDGYLVTAAHVVAPSPDELRTEFAVSGLESFTEEDIATLADDVAYTPDQLEKLTAATQEWYARYLKVGKVKTVVSAQVGVSVVGVDKSTKGRPVEVVDVGEPYPGKDVAILKLDGNSHLPTLPLGSDEGVSEGDTLHVAGYPAASTFSAGLSEDSEVQPTITQGPLTAIKKTESGSPVFQTQAPASPGNSGGPVLDDSGRVVGILVASAVDANGNALEGQEFVIPVGVVREKLSESNITAAQSDTTAAYDAALDDYYVKHYENAMPGFERVKALYPEHPYVNKFIVQSQTAIDQGKDESPSPVWVWFLVAGVVLFALLASAVLALVVLGRRRHLSSGGGSSVRALTPPGWGGTTAPGSWPLPADGTAVAAAPEGTDTLVRSWDPPHHAAGFPGPPDPANPGQPTDRPAAASPPPPPPSWARTDGGPVPPDPPSRSGDHPVG